VSREDISHLDALLELADHSLLHGTVLVRLGRAHIDDRILERALVTEPCRAVGIGSLLNLRHAGSSLGKVLLEGGYLALSRRQLGLHDDEISIRPWHRGPFAYLKLRKLALSRVLVLLVGGGERRQRSLGVLGD
jgi:hypothetical protein